MRLLHFALITKDSPQWGLRNALRLIASEYEEYSWWPLWASGYVQQARTEFVKVANDFKPDAIFLQVQTPNVLPAAVMGTLPGFIFEWCGDCRDNTPEHYFVRAPFVDVMMFSNMRDVDNIRAQGLRAEYLNIGVTLDVFTPDGPKRPNEAEIVFLGNNYCDRFPKSRERQRMVAMLRERYGKRFMVHGNGWGDGDKWLSEPEESAAYRTCKIALNQNHYDDVPRFTSDRLFRAMSSGAFVVSNNYPMIEEDFEDGKHLVVWNDFDQLTAHIDRYLSDDAARIAIAKAGCEHVRTNHSWDARAQQMLDIMKKYAPVPA